jgi:hypothetical protein
MDARIGVLSTGKFYAFAHGYCAPETVGTLAQVEIALGLRTKVSMAKNPVRSFNVTVTPKSMTWCGATALGEYVVVIDASTAANAITKARQDRRDQEGRFGVAATYSAKLSA